MARCASGWSAPATGPRRRTRPRWPPHDDADLVGVWGRDPAKTEAAAARFGIAGYTDLDRLLAEVDAVAMAVPPDVQAELAVRAAAAGRHLLLDKPLALSLDGADKVAEAVAAGGVASLVFFTLRFLPEVAAWMEETGGAGGWHGGDGAWLGTALEPGSPFAGSPWRRRKGALWDLGPHLLALTIPTLGPVERVTAGTGLGDTVHLILGHDGGASSTLTLSQTVPAAAEGHELPALRAPGPLGGPALRARPPGRPGRGHPPARGHGRGRRRPPTPATSAWAATPWPSWTPPSASCPPAPTSAPPGSSARRAAAADRRRCARAAGSRGRWRRPPAGRTGPRTRATRSSDARLGRSQPARRPPGRSTGPPRRRHDGPQPGRHPAQPADGADELVAGGPEPRQPHQDHAHDPAEERDHQHDQGDDLQTRGGRPGGRRPGRRSARGPRRRCRPGRRGVPARCGRRPRSRDRGSARAAAMCSPTSSRSSWRRLAGRSRSSASRSWR